jgi:hypothetical protein
MLFARAARRGAVALLLLLPLAAACSFPPTQPPPGPHDFDSLEVAPTVGFGGGTIHYPSDDAGPFGVVSLAPGFTETSAALAAWGPYLAAEGYVVITINTSNVFINPEQRSAEQLQALDYVISQGNNPSSPLSGIVDPNRKAVGGHSMGGGGSLHSAQNDPSIDAVLPLAPWNLFPVFGGVTSPTLFFACQNDLIAPVSTNALAQYNSIPASTEKMFVSVAGGDHFCANSPEFAAGAVGEFAAAFLDRWVNGNASAGQFLCGPEGPNPGSTFNDVQDTCPF